MSRARGSELHALLLWPSLLCAACVVPSLSPLGKQCVPGECPAGWKCVYAVDAGFGSCQQSGCEGPPAPCERSHGVCAGAVRACLSDGGFEPVCTSLSYGPDFQPLETRCGDGLDNDCDGRVDVSEGVGLIDSGTVADLGWVSVDGGYVVLFIDVGGGPGVSSERLDANLAPAGPIIGVSNTSGAAIRILRVTPFQGGAVAVWADETKQSVVLARISPDGQPMTLSSVGATTAVVGTGNVFRSLSATADPAQANVLVSWVDSSLFEVQLAVVDATGAATPLPGLVPPDAGPGKIDLWSADLATTPPGYLVGIYLRSKTVTSLVGALFAQLSPSFAPGPWVSFSGLCGTTASPCSPRVRVVSGPGGDGHAAFELSTGGVGTPDQLDVLFDPLLGSATPIGSPAPPGLELDLAASPDDVAFAVWAPHAGGALSGETVTDAGVVVPLGPQGYLTPASGMTVYFPRIALGGGSLAAVGMLGSNTGNVVDGGSAIGEYICIP